MQTESSKHAKIHPDTLAFMDYVFAEIAVVGLDLLPQLKSKRQIYELGGSYK
ncbi:hypothetical protein LJC58_00630 [Lachnospiraceae bacterium OttesenSCG-928-D06]|nr:hypothetical protein [Lachnospiraceae bacterium OttesenSCG-928-D06]